MGITLSLLSTCFSFRVPTVQAVDGAAVSTRHSRRSDSVLLHLHLPPRVLLRPPPPPSVRRGRPTAEASTHHLLNSPAASSSASTYPQRGRPACAPRQWRVSTLRRLDIYLPAAQAAGGTGSDTFSSISTSPSRMLLRPPPPCGAGDRWHVRRRVLLDGPTASYSTSTSLSPPCVAPRPSPRDVGRQAARARVPARLDDILHLQGRGAAQPSGQECTATKAGRWGGAREAADGERNN
jgi:hypothetical protein